MTFDPEIFTFEEWLGFALRTLYRRHGYTQYRMRKFEEYDLYAENKDFLISENVITFTDAGGRLMALKPDVTLSLVRSTRDTPDGVRKLYYHENVYRPAGAGGPFRELTQVGAECLGDVDEAAIAETLSLAAGSLALAAPEWRLAVSHLGVLSALLDRLGLPEAARRRALESVERKSSHALTALCRDSGANREAADTLLRLTRTAGSPETVLPLLRETGFNAEAALLGRLCDAVGPKAVLDFSIAGNHNYYNGVAFQGYVDGVPESVLSGGQYDRLLRKLGRADRAIGFAVYLDRLARLEEREEVASSDGLA